MANTFAQFEYDPTNRTIGAVANVGILVGYAAVAAWRGFRRRRSTMSRGSWTGLALTLLVGFALSGFGLLFANAVDRHAPWVGTPGSNTRSNWVVFSLACLTGGVLLSFASLQWFGYGDPASQFPLLGTRWRGQTNRSAASQHDIQDDDD